MGRLRAYVADLQSSLNAHLAGLGSHERLEVDGEWGEHTALAFGRVCRVLGLEPKRNVRTFRLVVGATQQRTRRGARARPGRRRRLRAAAAPSLRPRARPATAGGGGGGGGGAPPGGDALARAIRADGGRFEAVVVREARRARPAGRAGLRGAREGDRLSQRLRPRRGAQPDQEPARRACSRSPRTTIASTWLTAARGLGNQGVGPMQLTSPVPAGPRRPARRLLAAGPQHPRRPRVPRRQHPPPGAARRGGGLQRLGPGRAALRRRRAGRARGAGTRACAARARRVPRPTTTPTRPRPRAPPAGRGPSACESPLMRGRDIAAFQQLLNERFAGWSIDKRIDVDGEYGPMTRRAARQAVYALGISGTELAHGVTPELRSKLRRPSRRTPDEVAHAARRRGWLGRLRRQHEGQRRTGGARLRAQAPRGRREPAVDQSRAAHRPLEPRDRHRRRAARGAATSPTRA